jgi:glycosyltransferase involved in cell wall biosynthesis
MAKMENISKLNVFIPRDGSPEGGVSSHIDTLVKSLPKNIQAHYHFSSTTPSFVKGALWLSSGFSKSHARVKHFYYRVSLLEDWLRQFAFSDNALVHAHDVEAGLAALRFREKSGRKFPIVYTVHGPLSREIRMDMKDEYFAEVIQGIEKSVYNQVERLIAVDQGQKAIVVDEFGVSESLITVISNAVDAEEINQLLHISTEDELGRQMREKRKQCRVLLVLPRRLVEKNGPLVVLEALNLLAKDVHLWVVGDGPLRDVFEAKVSQLGLSPRVWLLGAQPRKQTIAAMGLADIVLVPSVPSHGVIEATSIAALEGMALGKVVIASNIGGLAELIRHRYNGLLFEAGDYKALAELIVNNEFVTSQKIGNTAKTFVTDVWSVQTWVNKIVEVYKSAL